jgi:hypothetical protein
MLASEVLVEHVCQGRWAEARHPSTKELGATVIVKLDLTEASAKMRSGGPIDQEEDLGLAVWAGQIPLRVQPLAPISHQSEAAPDERAVPGYAAAYRRPGWTDPTG